MKRIIGIVLAAFFFFVSCGHLKNLETRDYTPPTLKYQPKIFYPVQAQENSLTGMTKLMVYVDKEGRVRRANLLESSGYQVLDSTAEKYCRNMIFNPALGNGKPIGVWLKLNVKFDVNRENLVSRRFVHEISKLYKKAATSLPADREQIQKLILTKDSEFVTNMTDALNFNQTIKKVLLPETVNDWKTYWDSYPLSFLLYYDFMQRFPDYRELKAVETKMRNALKHDVNFIKNTPELKNEKQGSRERLLHRLQEFSRNNSLNISRNSPAATSENF